MNQKRKQQITDKSCDESEMRTRCILTPGDHKEVFLLLWYFRFSVVLFDTIGISRCHNRLGNLNADLMFRTTAKAKSENCDQLSKFTHPLSTHPSRDLLLTVPNSKRIFGCGSLLLYAVMSVSNNTIEIPEQKKTTVEPRMTKQHSLI